MIFNSADLQLMRPELILLGLTCVVLLVDLFVGKRLPSLIYALSQFTLIATLIAVVGGVEHLPTLAFSDHIIIDSLAVVLKVAVLVISLLIFLYAEPYIKEREISMGDYYVLSLFCILGILILISAHNFITLYLGLELFSLPLYAMIALQRNAAKSVEAAMKYFVVGALASGMLLYGLSLVYGATGNLDIAHVAMAVTTGPNLVLALGLVFIVVGVTFKLGAAPFHMWMPDVYEGASTGVVLLIGSIAKIAAFAMIIRLLVEALNGLSADWQTLLILLVIASLAIGNIIAIVQTNIKRMLAYSGISHMGFILLGIMSGEAIGYSAALFYVMVYALIATGAFGIIILLSRKGFEADQLEDFKGLNVRHPWYAFLMMLLMLSMAGVPPTVGFYAKLTVLQAVIDAHYVWLAALAVFFTVIGLFYYLRVIKLMYFDPPQDISPLTPSISFRLAISINGLAVIVLGVFPGILLAISYGVFA